MKNCQRSTVNGQRLIVNYQLLIVICLICVSVLSSCSVTSSIGEDETYYTGMKKTVYNTPDPKDPHFLNTKEEIDAALACAPSSALFGSSTVRSPFPLRVLIYNKYNDSEKGMGKWLNDKFGKAPRLIETVAPDMRSQVAKNILDSKGYFNSKVSYKIIPDGKKKAKVAYEITTDSVYAFDSISVEGFKPHIASLIRESADYSNLKKSAPFDVATLEKSREQALETLRDSGYYFFRTEYINYLADSVSVPGKILLKIVPSQELPDSANHQWYIGKINIAFRNYSRQPLTDTLATRRFTMMWQGKRPLNPLSVMHDIKFRQNDIYDDDKIVESQNNLAQSELFTTTSFNFRPRTTNQYCDTLDANINCIFDKPYDASVEAAVTGNSSSRVGPALKVGLTRKNLFHGGEKITGSLFGSYEWQTKHTAGDGGSALNSYEFGADITLELPRIETPWGLFEKINSNASHRRSHRSHRRRYPYGRTTAISVTYDVLKRPTFFRLHTFTAALKYNWRTSETSAHQFIPLSVDFTRLNNRTAKFDSIQQQNPILYRSLTDHFIPKMEYTYTYTSPAETPAPIYWRLTLSEAGNISAACYSIFGKDWNEKDKTMFRNPFSQFVRAESDLTKTWFIGSKRILRNSESASLVWHLNIGAAYSYGNSYAGSLPYNEMFYVGGANSLRAFTIRSVGPGAQPMEESSNGYFDRVGTIKFETALEYRFPIVGHFGGAMFAEAGNVWNTEGDYAFHFKNTLKELATDVGIGLRYDLTFLVLRLDWGVALHLPYETSKSSYFNVDDFSKANGLHLAIGYPF